MDQHKEEKGDALLRSLVRAVGRLKYSKCLECCLETLTAENSDELWDEIIKLVNSWYGTIKVVIDYDFPLMGSIAICRFSWMDERITEENFPPPKSKRRRGKREVSLKLFFTAVSRDNRYRNPTRIKVMQKEGYRPAGLRELLLFKEKLCDARFKESGGIYAFGQKVEGLFPSIVYGHGGLSKNPGWQLRLMGSAQWHLGVRG